MEELINECRAALERARRAREAGKRAEEIGALTTASVRADDIMDLEPTRSAAVRLAAYLRRYLTAPVDTARALRLLDELAA